MLKQAITQNKKLLFNGKSEKTNRYFSISLLAFAAFL